MWLYASFRVSSRTAEIVLIEGVIELSVWGLKLNFHTPCSVDKLLERFSPLFTNQVDLFSHTILHRGDWRVEFDVYAVDDTIQFWKKRLHLGICTHLHGERFKCGEALELDLPDDGTRGITSTNKGLVAP